MTDRELRRLNRKDLLQMLLEVTEENRKLRDELEQSQKALADRRIRIERAGSLAEAALGLNEVFEAAQRAADQYVENVRALAGPEEGAGETAQPVSREDEAK